MFDIFLPQGRKISQPRTNAFPYPSIDGMVEEFFEPLYKFEA